MTNQFGNIYKTQSKNNLFNATKKQRQQKWDISRYLGTIARYEDKDEFH